MNVLSLFDGISCGMIALERTEIKVDSYRASEIEDSSIKISEHNYPDIIRMGDVTKWKEWDIDWSSIDLVLGGSPCQGFSRQGVGLNFEDPRSKLFFEFRDIVEHVKEHNPNSHFLLENVHMKKEWEQVITDYMGVPVIDINSKLVSAQNRPRLYWTNIEGVEQPDDRNILLKDILLKNKDDFETVDVNGIQFEKGFSDNSMKLVSNWNGEIRVSQSTKQGYIVAEDGDGVNLSFPTSKSRRGRVIKQKTNTLDTQCNIGVYQDGLIRRLVNEELERLQTLPKGYTACVSDRDARKAIGNGWTVDVIAHILSYLKND